MTINVVLYMCQNILCTHIYLSDNADHESAEAKPRRTKK